MAWSQLPTRTTADTNSADDVNLLQTNLDAIKGGVLATAPTQTLEQVVTRVGTAESDIDAEELATNVNIRGAESGAITQLASTAKRSQLFALSGTANIKLPKTGVAAGWEYTLINPGTYALTVNANSGSSICITMNSSLKVVSKIATPEAITDWQISEAKSLTIEKTYTLTGTEVTSVVAGWSFNSGTAIIYQTIDGKWYSKGRVSAAITSAAGATFSIATMNPVTPTTFNAYFSAQNYVNASSTYAYFDITFISSYTGVFVTWDFEIPSKPSWAT
jgi:hypothetical protein